MITVNAGGTTFGDPLYTDGIDTICLGWFIVHIHTKRPHVKNSKLSCTSVLEISKQCRPW